MSRKYVLICTQLCGCWWRCAGRGMAVFKSRIYTGTLTHLPMDTMTAISQTILSNTFVLSERFCILIRISMKFVPKGTNSDKWVLVQVMAWWRLGRLVITWINAAPIHWLIYAALVGDELRTGRAILACMRGTSGALITSKKELQNCDYWVTTPGVLLFKSAFTRRCKCKMWTYVSMCKL